ncbi:MAG: peptide ABC transporter permease [Microbacterium sp. SCN 70-200]|uniref:ABC transporter permease n=1 Tax=unclassified Microbacterium TaxID=2609290 RepID=UPI00086F209E|nr:MULTISPECIES: ABC transporter permease [unclassified Microbacterium]MBN9215296.1 ABC transporter permease [Microbacterium sp.]ODT42698.1 MAG: peptide ABC transporter permease [Microbacterium sp. SCN 70-200]OJV79959.1 MAG: peptide ABC transporter permease [Microbacterium sp. 70-16]
MFRYVLGRVGQAVLVLWAAYTVTFVILYLLPSDPVALQLSANNIEVDSLTQAQREQAAARLGLDRPVWEQYLSLLLAALRGDFGTSFAKGLPVSELLAQRLPGTVTLSIIAIGLSLVFGTALAVFATWLPKGPAATFLRRVPAAGVSVPNFWIGLLLIQVFAFTLGWLPATGDTGPQSLVLPAVTMAIPTSAVLAQVLVRSFDDTLSEPYIATARAKGLSRWAVQLRHAFRNAALPTLTILGLLVGATVTGSIVVETVFSRNGVGRLAQESVLAQDIPVVQAIVVIAAAAFVVVNLVVDLLYPLLDPRIAHTPKVSRA